MTPLTHRTIRFILHIHNILVNREDILSKIHAPLSLEGKNQSFPEGRFESRLLIG